MQRIKTFLSKIITKNSEDNKVKHDYTKQNFYFFAFILGKRPCFVPLDNEFEKQPLYTHNNFINILKYPSFYTMFEDYEYVVDKLKIFLKRQINDVLQNKEKVSDFRTM